MNTSAELYTTRAINRSRNDAFKWLLHNDNSYPRTWEQESADTTRRGYDLFELDFCAPPIAGYETLEAEGVVERLPDVVVRGQQRAHFCITDAGRLTLRGQLGNKES